MCDVEVNFYIPDELIGQCSAAEYFKFIMAKNSLDGINDYWLRDYLVYGNDNYDHSSGEIAREEWDFMVNESGIREAYSQLIDKVKEITGISIQMQCFPEQRMILGELEDVTERAIDKNENENKTMWAPDEYFNIDSMLKFITILGYDSFEKSGVRVLTFEY